MPRYGSKQRVRDDGYVDIYAPTHPLARKDGYVLEHRKVAYEAGLPVGPATHVHHINRDRGDNRLENLEVHEPSEHAALHANLDGIIQNQYGTWRTGTGFIRRHRAWLEELGDRHCQVCGKDINGLRLDATVCGNSCRISRWKRAQRAR